MPPSPPARRDRLWLLWLECGSVRSEELWVQEPSGFDQALRTDLVESLLTEHSSDWSLQRPGAPDVLVVLHRPGVVDTPHDADLAWRAAARHAFAATGISGTFEVRAAGSRRRPG